MDISLVINCIGIRRLFTNSIHYILWFTGTDYIYTDRCPIT